jgi:hypothetical protein
VKTLAAASIELKFTEAISGAPRAQQILTPNMTLLLLHWRRDFRTTVRSRRSEFLLTGAP